MTENRAERKSKDKPVQLVDEDDPSLTFLNTHVEGHDEEKGSEYVASGKNDRINNEEMAAEFPALNGMRSGKEENGQHEDELSPTSRGKGIGTFAIVLSLLSLFFLPVLLGIAGIACGVVTLTRGARALGIWAISIGAVSIVSTILFSPYF
ncbi:hypothetical protein [Shouchella shacheensis]|uniref:hypothetical protein n=1 Tax=Shouchella shacheensis TaxID=1649580 RepID=UPI00073FE9BA|nr:hypothetical protein [Shouchella shacheensis]